MNRTIILGGREISYELERKRVKNINLRIRRDCSIYVSANKRIDISIIDEFMQKKADYILLALKKFSEISKYAAPKHNYLTGESFRYLGKDLRLAVAIGRNSVISDGLYLRLNTYNLNDADYKEKLINKWYDMRCKEVFKEIIAIIFPVFQKYGITMPKLILRNMSSRWGSCQPKKGIITLNKRLIETPRKTIEYVVMHEFVHFLHPNHSAKFYATMSTLMPDWKARKHILENTPQ